MGVNLTERMMSGNFQKSKFWVGYNLGWELPRAHRHKRASDLLCSGVRHPKFSIMDVTLDL